MELENIVTITNLIIEIIFFILIGAITILTYISAKKTILQPIKTEIFKIQLEELSNILKFFGEKGEIGLRDRFDFNNMVLINTVRLFDDYGVLFFDLELNYDERPYSHKKNPHSIMFHDFITLADSPTTDLYSKEHENSKSDPRVRAALWNNYKHGEIHLTNKYVEAINELEKFISSPIIPKKCATSLESYLKRVNDNTLLIEKVMTKIAIDLPSKYPSLEELQRASPAWVSNIYNSQFKDLESGAKEITDFIREYWEVDYLLSKEK